ncbi:MAG: hypothetical protein IKL05_00970 [Clostridia bacterium]|nr:hypothetical protein [Clostridia bacterium]
MAQKGQLNWVFADGDLPPLGDNPEFQGHEAITVTNLNETPAHLSFDIYFPDRDPIKGLTYTLGAERVNCFRLDKPFCDQQYKIPFGQYSLVLQSDVPVVAVFGRLDVRQTNMAYYIVQGYAY